MSELTVCHKAKRARPSSSRKPVPPQSPGIYMVLTHPNSRVYNYSFYALKAENGPSKPLPEPLFRCKRDYFPLNPGVGAVGSKIYIFGGFRCTENPKDQLSLDTYVFDTAAPLPPPSARVDPKDFLGNGPQLNHPKFDPVVITFQEKIFVFPRVMSRRGSRRGFNICEVLDPQTNKWKELPNIPLKYNNKRDDDEVCPYPMQAYLVHDSTFVAEISGGIYCLDLSCPLKWTTRFYAVKALPFFGEGISMDGKYLFALSDQKFRKFDLAEGLIKGSFFNNKKPEKLSYLIPDCRPIWNYRVKLFRDDKLCLVTNDSSADPSYFGLDNCCKVGFHIVQVGENETKRKKTMKKENHQSGIHLLSSSTFTMPNTKEFLGYGRPIACFDMHDG